MATSVIMPALEMAQESGLLVSWLKREGDPVVKGEPLMEIETDKVTVEIEAPASGFLGGVSAREGDVVPVGQTIAWIVAEGESPPAADPLDAPSGRAAALQPVRTGPAPARSASMDASPLARRIAEEHGVNLALIPFNGKRIEKADVLAFVNTIPPTGPEPRSAGTRLTPASPKARRIASERGVDLRTISGSGPGGAILAADVPLEAEAAPSPARPGAPGAVSNIWRVMAERMSASWTSVPHFYLVREVDAGNLIEWRGRISAAVEKQSSVRPTYTDLLIRLIGFTLRGHPRLNASWSGGELQLNPAVNVGVAIAVDDGLIVPVIRNADGASISEIARQRQDLVERARSRRLRPADVSEGTFTLSNLGMYNVDAFNAIINSPQAAILAVGRIAERVVPVKGQIAIRPMLVMTLSCDHRAVDGARAAQFLDDLAAHIEDPWRLLV